MAVPSVVNGRGSWSKIGKHNNSARYAYFPGLPLDGDRKTLDVNHEAVAYAVKEIQKRCNELTTNLTPLVVDNKYGIATSARIKIIQKGWGLLEDGQTGSITSNYLWKPLIALNGRKYSFDPKYLYGQVMHESTMDIGAVGYVTWGDRGLSQINLPAHPEISVDQAFDSHFCLDYSAKRFSDALRKYASKPDRQLLCAILQHNNPVSAAKLFNTGIYSSEKSRLYVEAVLKAAASY